MKRIAAVLLALLICLPAFASASPVVTPAKEEIVYAKIDASGAISSAYIVNGFPDSTGEIRDYGDYSEVINLSTSDQITRDGDALSVDTEPGDFYYQGTLKHTTMPWNVAFTYRLNGTQVSPDELQGKSGDVTIEARVNRNSQVDEVYAENYMLQISMNLPTEAFHSITSEGATIATAGDNKVLTWVVLPGKDATFTASAQATDALLGQIQIAALPFAMAFDMPDVSEFTGELAKLESGIADLAAGVEAYTNGVQQVDPGQLVTGAHGLADGATQLSSGAAQAAVGNDRLAQGVAGLTLGVTQLAGGLDNYATGMDTYASGMAETSDGIAQLSDGLNAAVDAAKYGTTSDSGEHEPGLIEGSKQIREGIELVTSIIPDSALTPEQAELLRQILPQFARNLAALASALDDAQFADVQAKMQAQSASIEAVRAQIAEMGVAFQDPAMISGELGIDPQDDEAAALLAYLAQRGGELGSASEELAGVEAELGALADSLQRVVEAQNDLKADVEHIASILPSLDVALKNLDLETIATLLSQLDGFAENYAKFDDGLNAFVDGIDTIARGKHTATEDQKGLTDLVKGVRDLTASAEQLAAGARRSADAATALGAAAGEVSAGQRQLASGSHSLASGADSLRAGTVAYSSGIDRLAAGLTQLQSSGSQLAGGAGQLRESTTGMSAEADAQIAEAMSQFEPKDFDLPSYADERNTDISSVQFTYLFEGQSAPQDAAKIPDEQDDRSWWQRLIDLFR